MKKRAYGFTIVELLIVIVVIAILAAISIIAYRGIQDRATATTLQSDLRNAATQLGIAKATDGTYPSPSLPIEIKGSNGTSFSYSSSGDTYCLTATTDRAGVSAYNISSTGSIVQGACSGHTSVTLSCPSGFIPVPGNSHYGTSDFCVMKYEAKNVGGVATSQAGSSPWTTISQSEAATAAQNACSGCRLITDPEWMTIAMNVISVPSNWVSGTVGSGAMYKGHTDANPNNPLAAGVDDSDNYAGTGNAIPSDQRRTYMLTNGEIIWDLSGNVREWTDATLTGGQPGLPSESAYSWKSYNNGSLQWNSLPVTSRPTGTLYPTSQGVGGLYSNAGSSATVAIHRGNSWTGGGNAGVLALILDATPTSKLSNVGFRVAK